MVMIDTIIRILDVIPNPTIMAILANDRATWHTPNWMTVLMWRQRKLSTKAENRRQHGPPAIGRFEKFPDDSEYVSVTTLPYEINRIAIPPEIKREEQMTHIVFGPQHFVYKSWKVSASISLLVVRCLRSFTIGTGRNDFSWWISEEVVSCSSIWKEEV